MLSHFKVCFTGYGDAELNEAVSVAARDCIQRRFPDARVRVRNGDANETIATAYMPMAAAKWSFCGSSTFCLYPALATTGESNIMQTPPHARRPGWLDKVIESFENVHYVGRRDCLLLEFVALEHD